MSGRQRPPRTAALLLAGLLGTAAAAAAQVEARTLVFAGVERTYQLFVPLKRPAPLPAGSVPEPAASGEPLPLLVLLHGSGRDGLSQIEPWRKLAAREGIVLAAPESIDSRQWAAPADGPDLLHELAETLAGELPIDRSRIYLFGHSAGASFALQMAIAESRYFAAAAVHAGRLYEQSYRMADMAKRKVPILIVVGTVDRFFPLSVVRETRDALASRGFGVELREIPGHDHNYYARSPAINEMCWEFLQAHVLDAPQEWISYTFE